uniref:Uncharacterized protein n=1 Tax=Arundo donax TaxID=35708 RepID=A0A0A9GY57_ARUDO
MLKCLLFFKYVTYLNASSQNNEIIQLAAISASATKTSHHIFLKS